VTTCRLSVAGALHISQRWGEITTFCGRFKRGQVKSK